MRIFITLAVWAALAAPAWSQSAASPAAGSEVVKAGTLEISRAFAKAMLPGQPVGGGYLAITNTGQTDDRLVSASSPAAGAVELHEMAMQGQIMKMRKLDKGIAIAAGKTVELAPGGLHMMFTKVAQPFKAGDTVPLTLKFEKAGSVDITLSVTGPAPAK